MSINPVRLPALFAPWSRALVASAVFSILAIGTAWAQAGGQQQNQDTVRIHMEGNRALLELALTNLPPNANQGSVMAMRGEFAFWTAPLERQGNRMVVPLDAERIEGLLLAERLVAQFPTQAEGEPRQIPIPRERYVAALEPTAPLLRNHTLFYRAPEALPENALEQQRIAHQHETAAARARAHALFLDMRTAGRLPWSPEVLDQLSQNYGQAGQAPAAGQAQGQRQAAQAPAPTEDDVS
jgi:hypothetical protein